MDNVYMDEAVVLLTFIANDKQNERLANQLKIVQENVTALNIQYGNPNELRNQLLKSIEKIQNLKFTVLKQSTNTVDDDDNDLPDFNRLGKLKEFQKSHKLR